MNKRQSFILPVLLISSGLGCKQPKVNDSPAGYDLTKPIIYKMPSVLNEISGICFINGNSDTIYAEQDEEGKLFYFHPGDKEVRHTKFLKRGDYEDVAVCNGIVIMLRSDGVLFTFNISEVFNKEIENVTEHDSLLPEGEYESLYADESDGNIYILCKNCSNDKANESISGYIFHVSANGEIIKKNNFLINTESISGVNAGKNFRFKASALAQNRTTNQWYIVSSVNKMLLVTDDKWRPVHTYLLDRVLFTQPEGIAFDRENNLYISNEMGEGLNGTILKFLYNKK